MGISAAAISLPLMQSYPAYSLQEKKNTSVNMCVRMGLFTIAGKQCKGAINKNQFRTHISPFTPFYRPLIPPARDIRNFFSSLFFFSGKSGEEEICSWAQPKVESKKGGREKEKTLISGESGVCVRALFFS